MSMRRKIILEIPETMRGLYDTGMLEAQKSFKDTLAEAVRQIEGNTGWHLNCESLADIIARHCDPTGFVPEKTVVVYWLKGSRPKNVHRARIVAEALKFPEEYVTRFYEASN